MVDVRILTVIRDLGPGGIQRTAQNVVTGYRRRGTEVAVLALEHGGPREAAMRAAGIETFIGGRREADQMEATKAAARWKPDIIHVHDSGPLTPPVLKAVRRLREGRASWLPVMETSSFGKVSYSPEENLSDVCLLKSRWMLWKWHRWSSILKNRPPGIVVPNPVDVVGFGIAPADEVKAFRASIQIPPHGLLFGRVGQPDVWKWHPWTVEAFAEFAKIDQRAYLLLVGASADVLEQVRSLPTSVRDRVRLIPFISDDDDLRRCYSAMDVFLHAARIGESFGMVLAEALCGGTPVITLSTPAKDNSQLEVVGHMRGGVVVNSRRGMVRAMTLLASKPDLRQRLAAAGSTYIASHFSVDVVVDRLHTIAELAIQSSNAEAFRRTLNEAMPDHVRVLDQEIQNLMEHTLDPATYRQRLARRLVHSPRLYRAWSFIKFRR